MATVTTNQRQGVNSSKAVKVPCRVASTSNITLSGEQTIDGVAVVDGDRVLVTGQTDASENGIYDADTGAWTRAKDWDGVYDVVTGTATYVHSGTSFSGWYEVTTTGTITVGTTSVTIVQSIPGGSNDANVIVANSAANATQTSQNEVNEYLLRGVRTFYAGNGDGTTDDRDEINNANTDGPFRLEEGNYHVATNLTISSDVYFDPGAILEPDTGVTITITGAINAGDYQIFGDAGDISFTGGVQNTFKSDWFGVLADNSTNNSTALYRMRDALRTTSGCTLDFPQGTVLYDSPYWIKGIDNLVVNAWGTKFKNTQAGGTGVNIDSIGIAINANAFDDFPYTATAWPGDNHTFGYLIDTVAAGGSAVVCSTAADSDNFAVGDKVIVYGYGQQAASYPPNPRYFEYKTVLSAAAGTVTFNEVLKYRYRSDWWDFSTGKGAARIINMSRTNYDLGESLVWNGGEFLVNTSWAPGGEILNGKMQLEGYRNVTLNDVIIPGFAPSVCENIEVNKCRFNAVEIDKVIHSITFNDCEINHLSGATGVNVMTINGGKIVETGQAFPRKLIINGTEMHCEGSSAPTVMFNLATAYHTNSVQMDNVRFNVNQSDLVGLVNGGSQLSVTAATAPGNTSITVTAANDEAADNILQSLDEGLELRTASGGKSFILEDAYQSAATTITLTGNFSAAPAGSDVYYYPNIKNIQMTNIQQFGEYIPMREIIAFPRAERMRVEERDDKHFFLTYSQDDLPLPASAAAVDDLDVYVRATLKSVYINVWKAGSSGDAANTLQVFNLDTTTSLESIDLRTTGARYMTEFANSGSAGADTLANLSGNSMEQVRIRATKGGGLFHTYADHTELPAFTLVLEFVRYR